MQTKLSGVFGALAEVLLCMVTQNASAQEYEEVIVRAIGAVPNASVVAHVAQNSLSTKLDPIANPEAADMSAEQLSEQLCGILQSGYLEELKRINKTSEIKQGAMGSLAYVLSWPACLRVGGPLRYIVQKGDTLTSIRRLMTGEFADGPGLKSYFEDSGVKVDQVIHYGTVLTLPFETSRTVLRVSRDQLNSFETDIRAAGGREIFVKLNPVRVGRIAPPAGSTQGGTSKCVSDNSSDYPFDPDTVAVALEWLKTQKISLNMATVVVADNGFFGVPCTPENCPEVDGDELKTSERFPSEIFAPPGFYSGKRDWIGPRLYGVELRPVNYGKSFNSPTQVDEYSGHGTHVAGLVIGGPGFQTLSSSRGDVPRNVLKVDGEYKLRLSIVSLAQGTETLELNAEHFLDTYIKQVNGPSVVNLSVVFDTSLGASVGPAFDRLITENGKRVLFVVAAGNQDMSLNDGHLLPASLGGPARTNVITVASVDADGKLSGFSNRGKERVDIAAPGCHIFSWLDASSEEMPLSGTSQATAIVSFAAGILSMVKPYSQARELKNRLLITGDLLADKESREGVASMVKLNIAKSLYFTLDYITFNTSQDEQQTYLGVISPFSGMTCNGREIKYGRLRALKRVDNESLIFYSGEPDGELTACEGTLKGTFSKGPNILHFEPRWKQVGKKFEAITSAQMPLEIPAAQLLEVVRKDPK
jgi:hypothetical protein